MIPIKNVYYMLCYAFQTLNQQGYKSLAVENFDNMVDLCSAILARGIAVQIKRGLGQTYLERSEYLPSPRGRIDLSSSIKVNGLIKRQLICSYDILSVNSYLNRIIKSTVELLICGDLSNKRKKELRKLLVFFSEVESIDIREITWNIPYNRNNQSYRLLISICHLVIKGLIQTNTNGRIKLMDFIDEQRMCRLYEKFILEYYRKTFPQITVRAAQIPWGIDDGVTNMLPVMQSDIMLEYNDKILIIDAKYYSHMTQSYYDTHTLHSNNLYQIFTYVKNKSIDLNSSANDVSGMLLYAQTDEKIQPNNTYMMSGNKISVRTLNLNCDFAEIVAQLDWIIEENFGNT